MVAPTMTPPMADLWISVAATDTQQQIREKVAQKLSQAGFDVEQIGTTKLKVGAKGDQSFGYIRHWNYDATTDTLWNSIPGPKLVGRRGFPTVIINSQEAPLQD